MVEHNAIQLAIELARIAHETKSDDLVVFDLRGISPVTDFVVLSTGTSERQMRTVANHVIDYGKKVGQCAYGCCGMDHAAWILVDFVDVVFHIFNKPYREYYDLELLWGDAPRVEWLRSESA